MNFLKSRKGYLKKICLLGKYKHLNTLLHSLNLLSIIEQVGELCLFWIKLKGFLSVRPTVVDKRRF